MIRADRERDGMAILRGRLPPGMRRRLFGLKEKLLFLKAFLLGCRLDRPVFIVGCGRSGTTMLGRMMSEYPELCYFYEMRSFWYAAYPKANIWDEESSSTPHGQLDLEAEDVRFWRSRHLRALFWRYAFIEGRTRILEKMPTHSLRLPFVDAIFPGASFIHMVRSGLPVARSIERECLAGKWYVGNPYYWGQIETFARRSSVYRPLLDLCDSHLTRALLEWRIHVEVTRRYFSHPIRAARCLEVKYEEVLDNPGKTLHKIEAFLDLATCSRAREIAIMRKTHAPSTLAPEVHSKARTIAGPFANELLPTTHSD